MYIYIYIMNQKIVFKTYVYITSNTENAYEPILKIDDRSPKEIHNSNKTITVYIYIGVEVKEKYG